MLGLLVILVISWGLVYLIERKNIEVLGIVPTKKRGIQFFVGLFIIMLISVLNVCIETIVLDVNWRLNNPIDYKTMGKAVFYHLKSALTEDLVFRGVLLYILIKKLGAKYGVLLSALGFGIYHVFSYGIDLRIVPVLYVVIITGFTGYVWAYTFYKAKSIYMGLGFHLGVNLVNVFFFESQPYGELIFKEISRPEISEWNNFLFLIIKGLFPAILTFLFVKIWFKKIAN